MKYFLQYRFKVIIIFACYFLAAGLNLVWPYLSGTVLYDEILPGKKFHKVKSGGMVLLF